MDILLQGYLQTLRLLSRIVPYARKVNIRNIYCKISKVTGGHTETFSKNLLPRQIYSSTGKSCLASHLFPLVQGHCSIAWDCQQRFYSQTPKPKLVTMKIDSPHFHSLFTDELKKLIELFEKYNYELRIAGGAVRDLLTGKECHDIDFATTATPQEMKTLFDAEGIRMINMNGEKHGTITCRINDKENFEVTTLRIDVVTDGRHAEVEFTKDWQLDSLRRDLTINSMFLGFDGTVYDFFNGVNDLLEKKVRFVGNPEERIQEDYLRILRYFRFYGRISVDPNAHEEITLEAIRKNMHGLERISGERIWVELKKIVTGTHAASLMEVMMSLGMAQYVGLPEKYNAEEFRRVCEGCQGLNPAPMTLLSATLDSQEQVYELHKRLKLSRDELQTALFIVEHRNDEMGADPLRYCQELQCDTAGKYPKTKDRITELLKYRALTQVLEQYTVWNMPRFPVSGHKLLEKGVPKGPALAKVLAALRQKWKESQFEYTEDELMEFVEDIKQTLK